MRSRLFLRKTLRLERIPARSDAVEAPEAEAVNILDAEGDDLLDAEGDNILES